MDEGILEKECRLLGQAFIKHATTGLPYVTLKAAATLDGRIATRTGDSRWVTNERSRHFVHHLRCVLDGILVGVETAIADNPNLTARLRRNPPCRQPVRIVLDTSLRLPPESTLVKTAREVPFWLACGEEASPKREEELIKEGVTVLRLPVKDGRVDLSALLRELGKRQLTSLLVEGGARILGAFLQEGLADDFHFFYAPKILGDPEAVPMIHAGPRPLMSEAIKPHGIKIKRFGDDLMVSGRFHEELY